MCDEVYYYLGINSLLKVGEGRFLQITLKLAPLDILSPQPQDTPGVTTLITISCRVKPCVISLWMR